MKRALLAPLMVIALVCSHAVAQPAAGDDPGTGNSETSAEEVSNAVPACWNKLDERCDFDVDISLGWSLDNFTSSNLEGAANAEDSGEFNQNVLLDTRFSYKLFGTNRGRDEPKKFEAISFWLLGGVRRTVRGTEVLCEDLQNFPGCPDADADPENLDIPNPNAFFAILRNAESIEGEIGLRAELFKGVLGPKNGPSATPYVTYRRGFASVQDSADLARITYFSVGAVLEGSHLNGSFIEWGVGENELFAFDENDRRVFRVHLEGNPFIKFENSTLLQHLRFFIETEIEYDGGDGSDSVRSIVGMEWPFGFNKKPKSNDNSNATTAGQGTTG